jgi:hypothetical protein
MKFHLFAGSKWRPIQYGGQSKMASSSTLSFLAYTFCIFQPIWINEHILEIPWDDAPIQDGALYHIFIFQITSVKRNFIHHFKVFPKYIQLSKLVENCKIHIDGDFYERSLFYQICQEKQKTFIRIIWESWNRQIYFFL